MHVRFLFNVIVLEFWILQLNTALIWIRVRYTPDTYPRSILSEFLLILRIFLLRPYFRKYWIRPSPVRPPKPPWKNSQQLKRDISCDLVVCMVDPWKKNSWLHHPLPMSHNQSETAPTNMPAKRKSTSRFPKAFCSGPCKSTSMYIPSAMHSWNIHGGSKCSQTNLVAFGGLSEDADSEMSIAQSKKGR